MMTKNEFVKAIKTTPHVFGFVAMTGGFGEYIQLVKSQLLFAVKTHHKETIYDAVLRDGALYVN